MSAVQRILLFLSKSFTFRFLQLPWLFWKKKKTLKALLAYVKEKIRSLGKGENSRKKKWKFKQSPANCINNPDRASRDTLVAHLLSLTTQYY